jgi:hypothetical protein
MFNLASLRGIAVSKIVVCAIVIYSPAYIAARQADRKAAASKIIVLFFMPN